MEEGCVFHITGLFSLLLDIKKGTCCVHDYKRISIKKVNYYGWLNQGVEGGANSCPQATVFSLVSNLTINV